MCRAVHNYLTGVWSLVTTKTKKTASTASSKSEKKAPKATETKKRVTKAKAAEPGLLGKEDGKSLVIVESPAKAKTLQKYLGRNFKIEASVGHVKDLPPTKLGVDVEHDFEPQYVVLKGKEKVIERIRKSAMSAQTIYLAPDPDREGEAIAWHIAQELQDQGVEKPIKRATFNEITKRAVQEAIANPKDLNLQLYEAQQARRILDRLVGYQISPLLWAKVTRGLSAGRVQSVAVRMVVEREREIQNFVPEEFWKVGAEVEGPNPPPFEMRLTSVDGKKAVVGKGHEAQQLLERLEAKNIQETQQAAPATKAVQEPRKLLLGQVGYPWTVASVERKEVKRHPYAPFITSTLQQEAARKLGFGAKRTMSIAQRLYEGLELGAEGMTALITYMRTDSTRISGEAIGAARNYIQKTYGEQFLPPHANVYTTKKGAQDAHEAIRPTDMELTPEKVAPYLDKEQLRLYTLIWNRFVACQMADALFEQTKVESSPKPGIVFTATGLVQKFSGYLAVYEEGKDDAEASEEGTGKLPALKVGDELHVKNVRALQSFTQPPPRYTEASLVKELEKRGIGRPSTYATIVSVIQEKEYAEKDDNKRFRPTELGYIVTDLLVENFPDILDTSFTAQMEEKLDQVEEGTQGWKQLLHDFYHGFRHELEAASQNMKRVKGEATPTDILCDKCGQANLVIKWGRSGRFLACPRYPECKNTKDYATKEGGEPVTAEVIETNEVCDNCGRKLVVKTGKHGRFLACPGYPECKTVRPYKTGVKCPKCHEGDIVERTSKRGKLFFGCSAYPKCDYVSWNRPVDKPCPKCGADFMVLRETAKKRSLACPNEQCKYVEELPDQPERHDEENVEESTA